MEELYALSPLRPRLLCNRSRGGGFSSGHRWGILGGRQGETKAKSLVEAALDSGGKDNITIVIADRL